jgi:hypothetical protein
VTDLDAVRQLIARFANSFDLQDWPALGACLADSVHTDYSDLRGTPPETMSRERFVELRRAALAALRTHHLAGNVDVSLNGGRGVATVSMVIYRRGADDRTLDSHCVYTLGLARTGDRWRIDSIVQRVLWSDGQTSVHPGITR